MNYIARLARMTWVIIKVLSHDFSAHLKTILQHTYIGIYFRKPLMCTQDSIYPSYSSILLHLAHGRTHCSCTPTTSLPSAQPPDSGQMHRRAASPEVCKGFSSCGHFLPFLFLFTIAGTWFMMMIFPTIKHCIGNTRDLQVFFCSNQQTYYLASVILLEILLTQEAPDPALLISFCFGSPSLEHPMQETKDNNDAGIRKPLSLFPWTSQETRRRLTV